MQAQGTRHYWSLTSLRGIAAWWVVLYHFREALGDVPALLQAVLDQGFLAVDLFFVLSGFVIYANYHHLFERITARAMGEFMLRRFARIYPLHFCILLLYLANPIAITLFSTAGTPGDRYSPGYFVASLFLVQNWGFLDGPRWNIPAWSISTELGAYLLFPLMALVLRRVASTLMRVLGIVVSCVVIAWVYRTQGAESIGDEIASLGLFRCVTEFAIGVLIGGLLRSGAITSGAQVPCLAGSLLLAILGVTAGWPDYFWIPVAFALLVAALVASPRSDRWLSARLAVYLGEISYSTYLVHYLVKDWVKFLSRDVGPAQFTIYLASVLLLSMLLYRFVERPGREGVQALAKGLRARTKHA